MSTSPQLYRPIHPAAAVAIGVAGADERQLVRCNDERQSTQRQRGFPRLLSRLLPWPPLLPLLSLLPLFILLTAFIGVPGPAEAKNPLSQYLSRLLDESKVEFAIGQLMRQELENSIMPTASLTVNAELVAIANEFAAKTPRPNLPYQVLVLDSTIPGEIPLPGGTVILTTGLLKLAEHPEQRVFLVVRNMMHVALRHPINLMKLEGLYAGFLKHLKVPADRRNTRKIRGLLRDYLRAVGNMNHLVADQRALSLLPQADATRAAMLPLLHRLEEMVWPLPPWEWGDLPARIEALETGKGL